MYTIEKTYSFEAGHQLPHTLGKCRNPHGHSYVLQITLTAKTLPHFGPQKNMILDFDHLDDVVNPMIENYLDHKWLNDTLNTDAPTVEFISKWIFEYLKPNLHLLIAVTVFETPTCKATYSVSY